MTRDVCTSVELKDKIQDELRKARYSGTEKALNELKATISQAEAFCQRREVQSKGENALFVHIVNRSDSIQWSVTKRGLNYRGFNNLLHDVRKKVIEDGFMR